MSPAELRERLEPLVSNYPRPQLALVPLLHVLLDAERPISNDALAVVADICGVEVRSVAEMIEQYSVFQNDGHADPSLCLGLVCWLNGAQELLSQFKAELPLGDKHIGNESISPCLGHCYAAPVLRLKDGTICKMTLTSKETGAKIGS